MKEKKLFTVKNVIKAVWVIYALFSIINNIPKLDQMFTQDYEKVSNHIALDDGWTVTIGGKTFSDVSLTDLRFPAARKGDQISMQRVLPDEWPFSEAVLRLPINQTSVSLYIDGELIYEYGHERIAEHKTVGSGYQFINFPEEYCGKTLLLNLTVSEDKAFTKLDLLRIYPWENAYRVLMTENRLPLFLGSFLTIFGLAVLIMTVFAIVISRKYFRLLCISCFSFCIGLWTLCYYRVMLIYAIPLYSITLMEYISLYLAPIPLILYMRDEIRSLKKPMRAAYWTILGIFTACVVVMMGLHTYDIVHLAAMLPIMFVLIVIALTYFLAVIIMNFRRSQTINRLYLAGILIIIFCTFYDLIGYSRNRYYGDGTLTSFKGVSSVGVMAFIFILLLSFYIEMTQKMMQETERNSLIKSAYTDELTQLNNRRFCMEYIEKLKEKHSRDYTIICFDLNNLKTVNDTYGHAKGDILIQSTARVLEETFGAYGIVSRMGGDEFIAILDTADSERVAGHIMQLQENIKRKNREIPDLNMSIACGCAFGNEDPDDIMKVYQIADNRMYEHKRQMKQAAQ